VNKPQHTTAISGLGSATFDINGNLTTRVYDATGPKTYTYRYDPYGRLLASDRAMAAANVYRFSSKEVHPKSGLYYYGFRFYDPTLQRWLNRDPIYEAGGVNLYGFVENNPMMRIDPHGLFTPGEWLQIAGAFCDGAAEGFAEVNRPMYHHVLPQICRSRSITLCLVIRNRTSGSVC